MKKNFGLILLETVTLFIVIAACLFLPSETSSWSAGWLFILLFVGFFTGVNFWLSDHNPSLLKERIRLGTSDQKGWDKVLFPLIQLLIVGWLVLISLDAARFHWSSMPVWIQIVGTIVLACSFYILFLTFKENSYLSPVVRLQEERGQTVISSGPYQYVRHPMYSGIILFVLGTPLMLGSLYGVFFGLVTIVILAWRAVLEERTLQKELPGYPAYVARVKYRFIPFVW